MNKSIILNDINEIEKRITSLKRMIKGSNKTVKRKGRFTIVNETVSSSNKKKSLYPSPLHMKEVKKGGKRKTNKKRNKRKSRKKKN
jgi:hypothetical protein